MSNKIKHLSELKNSLSIEGKKKLIVGLKRWREKIAKENGDFNQYVTRNRGIQFTSKEMDSISNFKSKVTPTFHDKFSVKFETTDDFGNNTTCVIKKHLQGNQFVFTAYTKHDKSRPDPKPEQKPEQKPPQRPMSAPVKKMPTQPKSTPSPLPKGNPMPSPLKEANNMGDKIEVTKTITFQNDMEGSNILADFLRKIDL
jgi:hypothetical protein